MRRPRNERRSHATPPAVGAISTNDVKVVAEDLVVQPSRSEDDLDRLIVNDVLSESSNEELDVWMMDGEEGPGRPFEVFNVSGDATGELDLDPGQGSEVSRSSVDEGHLKKERTDQSSIYDVADTIYV